MSKLHLVFGGRVKDPRGLDFVDLDNIDLVGLYENYAEAEEAWRGKAQRTVDDAEMKYVVVHLHRLLEPDAEKGDVIPAQPDSRELSNLRRFRRDPGSAWMTVTRSDNATATAAAAAAGRRGNPPTCAGMASSQPLPARQPADHHLQHDPGGKQPRRVHSRLSWGEG